MDRHEFIAKHRDVLLGIVADAAVTQRAGTPLADFLNKAIKRLDLELSAIYEELSCAQLTLVPSPAPTSVASPAPPATSKLPPKSPPSSARGTGPLSGRGTSNGPPNS